MNMRRCAVTLLSMVIAAFLVPAAVLAAGVPPAAQAFNADTLDDFAYQAERIRAQMIDGGRYADFPRRDLRYVEELLHRIHVLLERSGPVSSMSQEQKIDLMNLQERTNAVLTRNEDNRLECEWTLITGTHRRQQLCMTASEREDMRARDRAGYIQRVQQGRVSGSR